MKRPASDKDRIRHARARSTRIPLILFLVFATAQGAWAAGVFARDPEFNFSRVPRFGLLEAAFELNAPVENPFDPAQIDVYAMVRGVSGPAVRVQAFFFQDFRRAWQNDQERLEPVGTPRWHVRFTPRLLGKYRITFFCKTPGGLERSETYGFECVPSDRSGFVRVAPNAQAFQTDDGAAFFAIGLNTCWGKDTHDYERWLVRMAENGVNTGRLWIGPMFLFDPEPKEGLGRYDFPAAWRLDYVLQLAERHHIRLMLCLESFNSLRIRPEYAEWRNNPYNAANGGPCAKPEEFFTHPRAKELFQRRLRYLVARWGYSPHVLAWEFWNEVDLVETYVSSDVKAWHAEMAAYLASIDPNRHLLTTSYSKPEGDAAVDALPEFDFVQTHSYNAVDLARDFSAYASKQSAYARPHLLGEFGLHWEGKGNEADPEGLHLRETIWSTALSGSAGCGMSWWWDSYIHPRNLWTVYRPLAAFSADVPWNARMWRALDGEVTLGPDAPSLPVDVFLKGVPPRWAAHPSNAPQKVDVAADGTLSGHATVAGILHGQGNHADKHNPVTFHADSPQAWRLNVVVKGVSGHGGANLEIYIDETLAELREFLDEDPLATETIEKFNKAYSLDIPAGRHAVRVQNTGQDWIFCEYELKGIGASRRPPLRAFGRMAGDVAVCWIQNETQSHLARERKQQPRTVTGAALELKGLDDGVYSVETWNTREGSYETRESRVEAGRLSVPLPPLASDMALKLRRK